jgi:hypothetical protein
MVLSRRDFLTSTSAAAVTMALPKSSEAWTHGSAITTTAPVVANFAGADPLYFTNTYLNMAKIWNPTSSQVGWPGVLGGTNGYPNGNITTNARGLIYPDPAYYGHYLLSWTDSGGSGAIGLIGAGNPVILYSGGNGSATVFGISPSASGEAVNFTVQSGGRGVNIEFAYGLLIKAVGTDSGNIKFTTTFLNRAGNLANGMTFKFNNLTGLPAGPNSDGSWTIYTIDNNNFGLLNSSSVSVGGITINASGTVGGNTEGIYSMSSDNPTLSGNWTGANASNLVWCKKSDLADINAGKLVTQVMADTWKNLSPAYIRFMDQLGTQNIQQPDYTRRVTSSDRTWAGWGGYTPIAYWAGVMTNSSDTFTCPTNPTASPSSGAYVDNEVVIAQVSTTGQNTTQNPKMGITGRTGTAPIYDAGPHLLNITMTGSVPPSGTVLSFVFTGGGLSSPFTYNYTTSTSVNGPAGVPDTSLTYISYNIRSDLQGNVRGNSGPITTAGISCQNQSISGALMSFYYNQNINASGAAQLGAGFSISASDPTSSVVFTIGFMPAGYMPNNAVCTFTYSALLQGWICAPGGDGTTGTGGVQGGPPLEFLAELCARAGSGMWLNIGMLDSPTTIYNKVFQLAQATYNGQPAIGNLAVEYGNETWNLYLGCYAITVAQAAALGIGINSGGGYVTHALRTIQMAAQATAAWAAAGRSRSNLKIVNAYQFVNMNASGTSDTSVYKLNGSGLDASGTGTNVVLKAYGGAGATAITTNYSAAPNRPVDWCDWVSPATYWQGAEYSAVGQGGLQGGVLSNYNGSLLAAYNYAYGNSTQQQGALDFLSNIAATSGDMYNGTLGGSSNDNVRIYDWSLGSGNPFSAGYWGIGTLVASYDTSRSSTGTSGGAQLKLGVACYEGGWQSGPTYPSQLTASLNSLGYTNGYSAALPGAAAGPSGSGDTSTTAAANLYNLFIAWKNDGRAANLVTQQFNQFRAAVRTVSTRDAYASWYGFQGPQIWALWPNLADQSSPFQAYNAIAAWR